MTALLEKNNIDLSVIILNYNSKNFLAKCVDSILKSKLDRYHIEVIVADNASTDNSFSLAKKQNPTSSKFNLIYKKLPKNYGFSTGNNRALKSTNPMSSHVLFLNPDTTVEPDTFKKMLDFFKKNPHVDAATCDLILVASGKTQPESHRSFPTPLNSFWHFFGFGLPKLFPKSKFFNGYFSGHLDFSKTQKIDACVGAFIMLKRSVGEEIGWWNENYFFYGEDLDLCWQLKKHGFSLYFYPTAKAYHYQGISSGIVSHSRKLSPAKRNTKLKTALASTQAMRIFYQNNLIDNYPKIIRPFVWAGINLLEKYRIFKAKYL